MKQLIFIMLLALLTSCHSTKKLSNTATKTTSGTIATTEVKAVEQQTTKADKNIVEETTSETVEYFEPKPSSADQSTPPAPPVIKSKTTKTTIRKEIDKGTTEAKKETAQKSDNASTTQTEQETKIKETPKTNHQLILTAWFIGLAVGIVICAYWGKIKPFLLPFLRLFKKTY